MDLKSFPILYDEESREQVEKFIYEHFECEDESDEEGMICHEITSEYVHTDVYNFNSGFIDGNRIYVTCGMGARSQNSLRPGYDYIELMMFGSENLKNDIYVMNQLVNLSKYPFRSSWIGPFHTIDVMEEIQEKFGYAYLWFLPEFAEVEAKNCFEESTHTVKFLPLVPLYEDERNVLARMDESSEELRNKLLEALQKDNSMFFVDVPRQSLATGLEHPKIDIKDREAFANDLKDMLQEFIDIGDIDYEDDEDDEDDINDD